jgi:methenyltetrahydromethanopterin cyclohydrolase
MDTVGYSTEGAPWLNERAAVVFDDLVARARELRVRVDSVAGAQVVDAGSKVPGGLQAGIRLARISLADLGDVAIGPGSLGRGPCMQVQVYTDHPVAACLASQYAGWQVSEGKFFAMGSGPMRAAAGTETLFDTIGGRERPARVVGVLECRKPPTPEVVEKIARTCGVAAEAVSLVYAPTASLAGTLQVVARSIETSLHKLAELKFDLTRIVSAHGVAPLPPLPKDDLMAIGLTNDAILYGGRVILYVTGDDQSLAEIGPQVPSNSSPDHGAPFAEIFARYNHDFYAIDPHLFSPAQIRFHNVETGTTRTFGVFDPSMIQASFFTKSGD